MRNGVPQSRNNYCNPEFTESMKELKTLPNSWTDIVNCAGKWRCLKFNLMI